MSHTCGCGRKFKTQPSLSRHGKNCDTYKDRKNNKQPLNIENLNNNNITNNNTTINNTTINNITYMIIQVPYLNSLDGLTYNDISNKKIWDHLVDNHDDGISCMIDLMLTKPENRSFKYLNENQYLGYIVNRNNEKTHPPKWRTLDVHDTNSFLKKDMLSYIKQNVICEMSIKYPHPRNQFIQRKIEDEYIGKEQPYKRQNFNDKIKKLAIENQKTELKFSNKHHHDVNDNEYDTDTLSV
ncbi:MAG: hypothetical protein EOP34_04445 [Rickettsiales bacterium]|nr:MAG: hypothetical protein EOP34_04445 [Rickettsiales bacterium]